MLNNKELLSKKKEMIIGILSDTKDYFQEIKEESQADTFATWIKNVESGNFLIVVVGEFSSGKSTFLNALMRDKYLPSFSNETTATINFLRHTTKSTDGCKGKVYYNNGNVESLNNTDFDTIEKYVSTKSDTIKVAEEISHLDLFLESNFLEEGVTLVDSPGLNGMAANHREITEKQINESHASIFIFTADQPGRKTEFEFLKTLKKKVNTIIFVLNKIDTIRENEQTVDTVIEKIKENYKKIFPEENSIPAIFPIAAYQALVARASVDLDYNQKNEYSVKEKENFEKLSRMKTFEDSLWNFLTASEKTKQQLLDPLNKVFKILGDRKKELENDIDILSNKKDETDIKEQICEIENKIQEIKDSREKKVIELSSEIKKIERDIRDKADVDFIKFIEDIIKNTEDVNDIDELNNVKTDMSKIIERKIKKIEMDCNDTFLDDLSDKIASKYAEFASEINSIEITNINIQVESKFELTQNDLNMGVEEYNSEIYEIEDEISKLENEGDMIERTLIHERKRNNEIQYKRRELEDKKSELQTFVSTIRLPDAVYRHEEVTESRSRGGLIGAVAEFVIGPKEEKRLKTIIDTSVREEYKSNIEEEKKKYAKEIETLQSNYQGLSENGTNMDEIALDRNINERNRRKYQEKLDETRKEFKEKFKLKHAAQIRACVREITEYMDEIKDQFVNKLRKELSDKRESISNTIVNLITSNIAKQLEHEKKHSEILIEQLSLSEKNKKERIITMESQIDKIKIILNKTVELQTEIENESTETLVENI
jgi:GTPase Era involved in 16S rRNA processing